MQRLSHVMGKVKFPDDTVSREQVACAAWANSVGKRIAAKARAVRLVRTHLIVEVEDHIWQRQLFALRHQILRKLEQNLGVGLIEEIEFKVVPARRGPERALSLTAAAGGADEADGISDPVLRKIYKASRKRKTA